MPDKVFEVKLTHGVRFRTDHSLRGIVRELDTYTYTFQDPEEAGIDEVMIGAVDTGTFFRMHADVSKRFGANTEPYNEAMFNRQLEERCVPSLGGKQLDGASLRDYETLRDILVSGLDPDLKEAFTLPQDYKPSKAITDEFGEICTRAVVRLPTRQDWKDAEQRGMGTRMDHSYTVWAQLIYLNTYFGDGEPRFNSPVKPSYESSILTLSWQDFQALYAALNNKLTPYEPLTATLEGVMDTPSGSVPFSPLVGADVS